jgi:3-oxoacyl-[acyl-carrier protein] reductase
MDLGLQGKVVVITGGSRGIGRAIALTCAAEGANIAFCARQQDGIDTTVAEIQALGVQALGMVADVTEAAESVDQFIQASVKTFGRIDILINNVGGSKGKGLIGSSDEEWKGTFDLNLFHAVRVSRAVVPYMQEQGGGSIVTISSISGYKPAPSIQYGTAKAAEIFLSTALALELGPLQIRVNTVCPGSILFPGGGWAHYQERDPEGFKKFETEEFPLGRLGTVEEVARVVAFVASPAGSWINGGMIPVDGAQQQSSAFQRGPHWK